MRKLRPEKDEDTGAQVAPIVKLDEVAVLVSTVKKMGRCDPRSILIRTGISAKERGAWHCQTPQEILALIHLRADDYVRALGCNAGNDICRVCGHATDFACMVNCKDESVFCIHCKTFREMFQEVAESQESKEENKDAIVVADALEKLSVEGKKTEENAGEEAPAATKNEETKTDTDKKGEKPAPST
ncbi:hypothetical protein NC651_022176 [Populus alba x Populus x berolinensis]|nr:hypothetical protein NC651_022176 [Populus alba x Populus x berolinensis]